MKQSVPGRKRSVNMGLSLYQQKPPQNSMQIYTVITPSPGASHVQGTQQSQMVTVFTPQMTMCVGPSIAFLPIGIMGPPYGNFHPDRWKRVLFNLLYSGHHYDLRYLSYWNCYPHHRFGM